jgi:hypothetical protein
MDTAGWLELWHVALRIVQRQPPFAAIMIVTLAAFVVVMALEGVRASLKAIWRGHRAAPAAPSSEPVEHAMAAAFGENISSSFAPRAAAAPPRRRKALTLSPRRFRSPRPTIRRHPRLEFAPLSALPEDAADAALEFPGAV